MNCCNTKAVYVDNVPGKEYYYCRSCKQEVFTAKGVDFSNARVGFDRGAGVFTAGVSTGPVALPTVAHPMSYPVPPTAQAYTDIVSAAIKASCKLFRLYSVHADAIIVNLNDAKSAGIAAGDFINSMEVVLSMSNQGQVRAIYVSVEAWEFI